MTDELKNEKDDGRKGEFIRVKKDKLDAMIKRLERLEASASKAQLSKYDNENQEERARQLRLKTINGKVVVRWDSLVENTVEKNEHGVWYEKQTIKLTYEDGTTEEMPYVFFARRYSFITGELVSETKNLNAEDRKAKGDYTYKIRTDDAEYEIGSLFVN